MAAIPDLVIAHSGTQGYAVECIAAAQRFGCVHRITFDEPDTDPQYHALRAAYVHFSGGSVRFERDWCLRRYFLMRNLFHAKGIASGWLLDSDVLLVGALPTPESFPPGTICAMSMSPVGDELDRHYSAHCSYWTLEALNDFCAFLLRTYRDEVDALRILDWQRRSRGIQSAVGEMILLARWQSERSHVLNLFEFSQGGILDHNLRFGEQPSGLILKRRFGNKRLKRTAEGVFGETKSGERIRLRCIHFQGNAKRLMPDFAQDKMLAYEIKSCARYVLARMQAFKRRVRAGSTRIFHSRSPNVLPASTLKS